jgi:hypothetical protein
VRTTQTKTYQSKFKNGGRMGAVFEIFVFWGQVEDGVSADI